MAESEKPVAQWPVILEQKCELCDLNSISYKCLNCDEMICESCKKTHLKSKAAKDHKVVCLKSAEIYENDQIGKKCPSHSAEDLLMFCNTCNCPICRECVTSGVHLHHPMVKVEEVIDIKEKELSNIIKKTNEKSKHYNDVIKTITQNKLEFSMSIAKTIKEVKDRNNQLKSSLDLLASDYIKQLQNKDKEYTKAMTELEHRLQGELSELNHLIHQSEQKQRDRNIEMVTFVMDISQKLDKYMNRSHDPPDIEYPPTTDLVTRHVGDQEFRDLFGHLDTTKISKCNPTLPQIKNIPSASPAINAKKVNRFSNKQRYVVTTGNNQAWLWSRGDKCLSLVTSDGKVIQDINTDFTVFDAAVSTSGDPIVTVWYGNKVKKLTTNNKFTDIYTADSYRTQGITVTDTGSVLVGLFKVNDSMVVEITTSGQQIRTIQQHDIGNNELLLNNLWSICTNVNGDILVVDAGKVVVVNQHGQYRFTYEGSGRQPPKSFSPQYIVTDRFGHIIISDYDNSVVHILDRNGKFLQYIVTGEQGCNQPMGIDIDSSGKLWVCNKGNNKIFIVKYV